MQTQAKCEELQRRVTELEDQLYSTNVENDAIKEKFEVGYFSEPVGTFFA